MVDIQRAIVRHSVEDVIHILENEPVKDDRVPGITIVQLMNRVSIAHLSIERAFKFLIKKAGGPLVKTHDLRDRYKELLQHDPESAAFLEKAFQAAVRHYQYNSNATDMRHLKTADLYLGVAASNQAFQDIRYWELTQSQDEVLLRRIDLPLHIELLHGLSKILLAPNRPKQTVFDRVERAVENAMWHTPKLGYSPGTPKERSVRNYIEWRQGFGTWSDALADAVQKGFNIGDDFMADLARRAYRTLLEAPDPAVRYFASTLNVLPKQPRDVVPCVEWWGPEKERRGCVKAPSGTVLGLIERGPDGLWRIDSLGEALVRVPAKASSQTDARCYLGILLTRPVRVMVEGEPRSLRLVGEEHGLFQRNFDEINRRYEGTGNNEVWTHKVSPWDRDHGIEVNNSLRVEVRSRETEGVVYLLEGTVTEVTDNEVYLSGSDVFHFEPSDRD